MVNLAPEEPEDEHGPTKPGKTRTWWHPLLASFLRWQLGDHYRLQEEVPVGLKPLQIDILLLHQEKGDLPEEARKILAGLVERFGEYTLLEFKSPSDTLRAGDFQTFLAYALLWRAQNAPLLDPARMHLVVVAPRMTRPFREEFEALDVTATQEEPSVWRLSGGVAVHPTWLLETAGLVGEEHPVVTVLSPRVLKEPLKIYEMLKRAGYSNILVYLLQQVQQFDQRGAEFAMLHLNTEDEMKQVLRDVLAAMPLEERLASLSAEERLQGLSVEERLKGLSAEEWVKGLSPEALEQLRQALPPPSPKKPSPPSP